MKYRIHPFFLLVVLAVFISCNGADKAVEDPQITDQEKKTESTSIVRAAVNAIAPDSVRKDFKNLISFADCVSPLGKYTTQVNSTADGYMYVKQTIFAHKAFSIENDS